MCGGTWGLAQAAPADGCLGGQGTSICCCCPEAPPGAGTVWGKWQDGSCRYLGQAQPDHQACARAKGDRPGGGRDEGGATGQPRPPLQFKVLHLEGEKSAAKLGQTDSRTGRRGHGGAGPGFPEPTGRQGHPGQEPDHRQVLPLPRSSEPQGWVGGAWGPEGSWLLTFVRGVWLPQQPLLSNPQIWRVAGHWGLGAELKAAQGPGDPPTD